MLRTLLIVAAIVLGALAGAVQLASSAAYGDLAARPSLPAALHDRAPQLLRAFIGGRSARAAAAIHQSDLATAERLVASLPDDAETADLGGRIAQARGDRDVAIAADVRAGDVVRAQALIDVLAATDPARALADQEHLVAALHEDPGAGDVAGEAW